jgi:hypothetical protein
VGVLRADAGGVTGVDDAPAQALDLFPQRRLLVQQGRKLALDQRAERQHVLLVVATMAEPGLGKVNDRT